MRNDERRGVVLSSEQEVIDFAKRALKILSATVDNLSQITSEIMSKYGKEEISDYSVMISKEGKLKSGGANDNKSNKGDDNS